MKKQSTPPISPPEAKPAITIAAPGGVVWLKNAEAMAIAMGLKLYVPRQQKRLKQLEDVRAMMACNDFPAKDARRGYWPRAEVVAWLAANVTMHPNKRGFDLIEKSAEHSTTNIQHSTSTNTDLPVQAKPVMDGDLFGAMSAEELAAQQKRRLDYLEDIHLHPGERLSPSGGSFIRLSKSERDELKAARPHLFATGDIAKGAATAGGGDDSAPEFSGGVEAVAAYVQMKFPGVICNKMDISNWRRAKFLPTGCMEPFPPSHQSGRNKKVLIDAWVLKYLKPPALGQNLPGVIDNQDYDRLQKKVNFERAQEEFTVWKQANDKKYILRETANRTGTAIGTVARNCTREALEKALGKRVQSGLNEFIPDEAVRARFLEKLQAEAVSTFAEWQSNFMAALAALMKRNQPEAGPTV